MVEAHQILHWNAAGDLEQLFQNDDIIVVFSVVLLIELDLEMDQVFGVILSQAYYLRITFVHYLLQVLFIVFGPFAHRQLLYVDDALIHLIEL